MAAPRGLTLTTTRPARRAPRPSGRRRATASRAAVGASAGGSSQSAALLRAFQRKLLAWYRRHQRPLPWRRTRDPYKILVSEIMLQQTQVDRVIPKYQEFLGRYPTLERLSQAPVDELRKVWYPLGYNIRPMRLRKIAQQAVERHGGRIPDTYDGLIAMEGIGRYTAGAVLSFAFNQDAPILDTNVARLLQRYFGLAEERGLRSRLWQLAGEVIPRGRGYDINQAMMDFGAMICAARRPLCGGCALRGQCRSYPHEQSTQARGAAGAATGAQARASRARRH